MPVQEVITIRKITIDRAGGVPISTQNQGLNIGKKAKKSGYSKKVSVFLLLIFILSASAVAYAAPEGALIGEAADSTNTKAISSAAAIAIGAVAAVLAMATAISKSNESIARQPEAEGSIRTNLLLGLVFIETAVIYAFVISIMIIFVL